MRGLALLGVAAALAFAPAASADLTVPGCWGASSATYCDATVRVSAGETQTTPTPVCAGSCVYVGVPKVSAGGLNPQACVDYRTPSGYPASECFVDLGPFMDGARDAARDATRAAACVVQPTLPYC
ncbi:MAG TPA: hypothetical protein VF519_11500 [Mycobacteriales bacterium]